MPVFFPSSDKYRPWERLIRLLALLFVFGAVVWGFWWNTDRTITRLEAREAIYDPDDSLAPEQLKFVEGFAAGLKEDYGLLFKLRITDDPEPPEPPDAKTLYMGISPSREEAVLVFPPLMAGALGGDFTDYLRQNHFQGYFKSGEWREGLMHSLVMIWEKLENISGEEDKVDQN